MDNMKTTINERGDHWHPDPEKDKKLGGPGANQRAREDRADAAKPKSDPKKLRKGESYMDYAKRHGHKKSTPKKKSLLGRLGLRKEAYRVLAKDKGEEGKPSQFSYKDEKDAKKFAGSIKKGGGRATVSKEERDEYGDPKGGPKTSKKQVKKNLAKNTPDEQHTTTTSEVVNYVTATVQELNRYEKETGKSSGSMNMPKGKPTKKGGDSSPVMQAVRTKIRKETGKPEGQQKKAKGVKSDAGTGKYLEKQKAKKDHADKVKKAGFKNAQAYADTMARYGGESNYKAGRGLGT